jgi:hypothetical protein
MHHPQGGRLGSISSTPASHRGRHGRVTMLDSGPWGADQDPESRRPHADTTRLIKPGATTDPIPAPYAPPKSRNPCVQAHRAGGGALKAH